MSKTLSSNQKISTPQDVALYIAERLKITRRQKHVSLQDLAQKLEITRKQLQNYESVKTNISVIRLWKISSLLNVNITFFVEGLSKNKNVISNKDLYLLHKFHNLHNKTAKQAIINLLNDL